MARSRSRRSLAALGALALASLPIGCASPCEAEQKVQIRVSPSEETGLVLRRVDGSCTPIELSAEGGEYALKPGAWEILIRGRPWLPVPAFASMDRPEPMVLAPYWHVHDHGDFRTIPGGPALIGDRLGVGKPDERPARVRYIPTFLLGRTEITNAQYAEFLNSDRAFASSEELGTLLDLRSQKCRIEKTEKGFVTDAPRFPVVTVTWFGADAYCRWMTERTGKRHRLPTEDEWEKAARGPQSFVYSYGDVYIPEAANQASGQLKQVARYRDNGFGLFDMTGNAFEWTSDKRPATDTQPEARYLRGGSFVLDGIFLRNSFRMFLRPTVRADDVGFRVLREL